MSLRVWMRKLIRKLVEMPLTWNVLHFFYRVFYRFKLEKDLLEQEKLQVPMAAQREKMERCFSDLAVRNGPFKGMKYPGFVSYYSAMFPKLLGSYECELYEDLEKLLQTGYDKILDIGCAEGYYAVGLARRQPGATVYAYDIDAAALEDCRQMARLNGVSNIRYIHGCSTQKLMDLDLSGRCLIISDCEGFELELFTPELAKHLRTCDVLIELHDHRNERISPAMERVFNSTHNIRLVQSMNTFKKLDHFQLRNNFSESDVATFLTERSGIMNWGIYTPKT